MYEKFLIIAGRRIWKAVAEHKLNCRFVYLGEGAMLTDTNIEVLHFKRKKNCRVYSQESAAQDGQEQGLSLAIV